MFSHAQLDDLLEETAGLMDKLSQLDQASRTIKNVTDAILQSCVELKPRHTEMARDLERLRRLHEVLKSYVFTRPELDTLREPCHPSPDVPSHY